MLIRSGFNFFIGAEEIPGFPMFPDMSKIYKPIKGLRKIKVHTVGPSRFTKDLKDKQILSESAGLISLPYGIILVLGFSARQLRLPCCLRYYS